MSARILIVDDEPNITFVLQAMLERMGLQVEGFNDSRLALARISNTSLDPPDVIIADLFMPHVGGNEILRAALQHHPKVPVVIITAFGTIEGAVTALKNGAFDFVTKPFEQEDFLATIRGAVEARRLRDVEDPVDLSSFKVIVRNQTQALERELIERALEETRGNVTRAAGRLGLSRKGLQIKLRELEIKKTGSDTN